MSTLTSPANPLVMNARRAARRGALTEDGYCLAESFHLLDEALRSGCRIKAVLVAHSACAEAETRLRERPDVRLVELSDSVFRSLSATESSQGVAALVQPRQWTLEDVFGARALVVVLDGIQDPGNAGAIFRAAEAFRATGLLLTRGTVNPFNPKAIRASAGSVFRLPLVDGLGAKEVRASLNGRNLGVYAARPSGGLPASQADLRQPCAIIVGSEGHGIDPELLAGATPLSIRTVTVESLNAAVAAGILLYEASRQRDDTR